MLLDESCDRKVPKYSIITQKRLRLSNSILQKHFTKGISPEEISFFDHAKCSILPLFEIALTCKTSSCYFSVAPCLPTNIRTGAECQAEMLITTWDSALGAVSYTVEAQGNTGQTYNCTSSANSCAVTGVPCGEHLSVWISASNDNCTTEKVLGEVAQTGR